MSSVPCRLGVVMILGLLGGCSRPAETGLQQARAAAELAKAQAEAEKAKAEAETAKAEAAAAKAKADAEIAKLRTPQTSVPPSSVPAPSAPLNLDQILELPDNHPRPRKPDLLGLHGAKLKAFGTAKETFGLDGNAPTNPSAQPPPAPPEVPENKPEIAPEVISALYDQRYPDAQEGNLIQFEAYVEGFWAGYRGEPKKEAPPPAPPGSDPLAVLASAPPIHEWDGWADGVNYRRSREKMGIKPH